MKHLLIILILAFSLTACSDKDKVKQYVGVAEGTTFEVSSQYGGKLLERLVDEGAEVKKAQVVARLDAVDWTYQMDQLIAAKEELQAQLGSQGSLTAQASADNAFQQERLSRNKLLYQNQTISQQAYDDIRQASEKSSTVLQSAKYQQQVLQAKLKQVEAQINLMQRKIVDTEVEAPASGVISKTYYEMGEFTTAMRPIMEITSLDTVKTTIYVNQKEIPSIKQGQTVKVKIDGSSEVFTGTVSWISSRAEFTPKYILTDETRSALVYAVRISVPNPNRIIKHGMPLIVERG